MSEQEKKPGQWSTFQISLVAVAMVIAAIMGTFAILWQINTFTLSLSLNGSREVTLEYGDSYEELGAKAVFHGSIFLTEPDEVPVTIEGEVDTSTVGTYYITYTSTRMVESILGDVEARESTRRTVHVVDTVAPEIELVSNPDTFTFPGLTYQEEGFTATDNYDGDITADVVRTDDGVKVTYHVTDSSGNATEVVREIVYDDPVPPELNLVGKTTITLELGNEYKEPGFTANDNCDGDLTEKVEVTGTVDVETVGTYTLTYTVRDTYENEVTITRTVEVVEPETEDVEATEKDTAKETEAETKKKNNKKNKSDKETEGTTGKVDIKGNGGTIYLTFDDGPSGYTPRLLDILDKYDVKATFFVVKTNKIAIIEDIADRGHVVAMHTATHDFEEVYSSTEAYFKDLRKIQKQIEKYCGYKSTLLRFPGGGSNTISKKYCEGIMTELTTMVEEKGYTYFDWNVDSDDAGSARTATAVFNNVVTGCSTRKSSVVLMHDIKSYTVDAIEDIIKWGLDNGYTFKVLTASSPTYHHRVQN